MKFSQLFITSLLFASALLASKDKLDTLPAHPYCQETVLLYDFDLVTPLGFSGNDLLNTVGAVRPVTISYGYKAEPSFGTLSLEPSALQVKYIQSEPVYPSGTDVGIVCNDRMEVDVKLGLNSEDGAFADTWDATLVSGMLDFCFNEGSCPNPGEFADVNFLISLNDMKGNFYKDTGSTVSNMDFWGRLTSNEVAINITYITCECIDSLCSTYMVNGATLEADHRP